MSSQSRVRGAILPLLIVIVGVLLLLNTLDVVAWSVWPQLSKLWPVLVIVFGADLLWRHLRRPLD